MASLAKSVGAVVLVIVVIAAGYLGGAWLHLYGRHEGPGEVTRAPIPREVVSSREEVERKAAGTAAVKQILFGDLHVHTTFSTDAFLWSLPMMQGDGAHPIADACDYARFCSALDFWSINDHAEATTPQKWRETKETIRRCNAVAGDPKSPDVAVFLGWEWSQVGRTPEDHYGHKNVVLLGLEDHEVPARAIGAAGIASDGLRGSVGRMSPILPLLDFPNRRRYFNFIEFMDEVREVPRCSEDVPSPQLPPDCYESAAEPRDLFRKLEEWDVDALVIPHGNTWGYYSPPGTTWDKQLTAAQRNPGKQFLIEVMSGHGNSEEFRNWREIHVGENGRPTCPEPTPDYLPSCWRAGELAAERCRKAGGDEAQCVERAAATRQRYVDMGVAGNLVVPDANVEDWLDAGQCRDCFIPAFNFRPRGSTQYSLAISNFDDPGKPARFHFGFIASSDNHRARPGTGYKEFDRLGTTEANGARDEAWRQRLNRRRRSFDPWTGDEDEIAGRVISLGFSALEAERQASFFLTGGLAAVHASGRSREEVWQALKRKEVYGTSGDRILLWFHLLNGEGGAPVPMGGEIRMSGVPRFEARAVGALKQRPGCPAYGTDALSPDRLQRLCKGQCYNPSDERKLITRIEVVRIRPQTRPDEDVASLIEDPWRRLPCHPDPAGCVVEFEDPDFPAANRGTVYYVRAIEEPSPAVNGGGLRCQRDENGNCIEIRPCYGDYRTAADDDCLQEVEERAWSSPIYVDPVAGE